MVGQGKHLIGRIPLALGSMQPDHTSKVHRKALFGLIRVSHSLFNMYTRVHFA